MRRTQLFTSRVSVLMLCLVAMIMAAPSWAEGDTTTVYKVIGPDGSVTFSDQPNDNAEKLEVQPVATVPAVKASDVQSIRKLNSSSSSAPSYSSLKIEAPGNNTAFHSGSGDVKVVTKLTPALRNGDKYQFSLDGSIIATQSGGNLLLSTMDRGTHTISVAVVDPNLKVLIEDSTVFTIHRPKISRPSVSPP